MSPDKKAIGARLRGLREEPRDRHGRPRRSREKWAMTLRAAAGPAAAELPGVPSLAKMIQQWERGDHVPGPIYRPLYARVTGQTEAELFGAPKEVPHPRVPAVDDELEALELARRVGVSDVGGGVVVGLEMAVDDLASAYPRSAPGELLARTRRHLGYVQRLLDMRMTLDERRRLVVVGAWMSLLAATCDVDLGRPAVAAARLRTAALLAEHAGHPEIIAWTLETRAWQALVGGDHRRAVALARGAQEVAPRNGSAFIQATAQEGRAWARLGAVRETRNALSRVERLVAPLPMPDRPEHHFRYDPAKSDAYTATTLAWTGDPAAERHARGVLARLEESPARPRRAATARLDLALALLAAERADEAAHTVREAMASGRLVSSNRWRAAEIIRAVQARGLPEADDLREVYRSL
ncbi:transcriptional regulator [Actinomadura roseirufa]|uniref:transcriptional regulator n=1 Tax=Actinomadura roseirufa TaxID=2094049 RepID=UPI0010410CFD|nr:transcriptional regulator [Actinomadura roseirufa]